MSSHPSRRRLLATLVASSLAAATFLAAGPPAAAAELPAGTVAIAAGGSDTTQDFMGAYLAGKTSSTDLNTGTPYTIQTYNIRAATGFSPITVDGDAHCDSISYTSATVGNLPPAGTRGPNGSGQGRDFLGAQRNFGGEGEAGCLDIGRSSSGPSAGAVTGANYVAFGYDAVAWATASLKAPATLTRTQVKEIYNCTWTNWNQVGGSDGPIQRYLPQTGSGTRDFFLSAYGITALDLAETNGSCPAVKQDVSVQENDGRVIPAADIDKAIVPYSAGKWTFHFTNRNNPTLDFRNGVRLGGVTLPGGSRPQTVTWVADNNTYLLDSFGSGVVTESNVSLANTAFSATNDYPGIRFVFNIIDPVNTLTHGPAQSLVGFNNIPSGNKSPLCNGSQTPLLLANGFAPLSTGQLLAGSNLAGSTCRVFTVPAA